jgi:hypothetical protein
MRRLWLGIAMLAAIARPAWADVQNAVPPADASPPLSTWQPDDNGGLKHLQSGLVCPAEFRSYKRIDAHVYNVYGLDISCNYLSQGQSDLTVYLGNYPFDKVSA